MKISSLDKEIINLYLERLLNPIKYGENSIYFWFPGTGMTTTLYDIFRNRSILKKSLGNLTSQLKFDEFYGHLAEKKTLMSLLNFKGYTSPNQLISHCESLLDEGNEAVYLLGRIDDFKQKEKIAILKLFVKLASINPRRVHILFNTIDKPWFIQVLKKHPELLILANRMHTMPIISGKLLSKYIKEKSKNYGYDISRDDFSKVEKTYGGILQLTKEYLRSKGNIQNLELKFKLLWDILPKQYQEVLKQNSNDFESINDLKELGVLNLEVFNSHKNVLDINPEEVLRKVLTEEEFNLWRYAATHHNELLSKDLVVRILRPKNSNETSLWAIDKAVSRFRIKLAKAHIDPSIFKTVKRKGYIWKA